MMSPHKISTYVFRPILHAKIAHCDCYVRQMNGQMDTDFGHAPILISNHVRNISIDMSSILINDWRASYNHVNNDRSRHMRLFVCCRFPFTRWFLSLSRRVGKEFRETCSGHGKHLANRCKCDKKYYGSRCQYSDECVSNDDCGNQGKCIDLQGSSMPRRQCFCNFGWFGPNCAKSKFFCSMVLPNLCEKSKSNSNQFNCLLNAFV